MKSAFIEKAFLQIKESLLSFAGSFYKHIFTSVGFFTAPANMPSPAMCKKLSVGRTMIFRDILDHPIWSTHNKICHKASKAPSRSSRLIEKLLSFIYKVKDIISLNIYYTVRGREFADLNWTALKRGWWREADSPQCNVDSTTISVKRPLVVILVSSRLFHG